jgi:hypothetical protein
MIVGLMVYMFVVVLYVIADAEPGRREKRSGGQVPSGPAPGVGGQASAGLP